MTPRKHHLNLIYAYRCLTPLSIFQFYQLTDSDTENIGQCDVRHIMKLLTYIITCITALLPYSLWCKR